MKDHFYEQCAREFDSPMLKDTNKVLSEIISEWITITYGKVMLEISHTHMTQSILLN